MFLIKWLFWVLVFRVASSAPSGSILERSKRSWEVDNVDLGFLYEHGLLIILSTKGLVLTRLSYGVLPMPFTAKILALSFLNLEEVVRGDPYDFQWLRPLIKEPCLIDTRKGQDYEGREPRPKSVPKHIPLWQAATVYNRQ